MPLNRLTAKTVEATKIRGRYSDGGGLVLQISKWGTKSWAFRYQRVIDGRALDRHMGLGSVNALSLADARDRARACRELLAKGRDPIEVREAERKSQIIEASRSKAFRLCAEEYIKAHRASWKNAKHREQWEATLQTYVLPVIGALAAAAIDTPLVLKCLEPIWLTKTETAKRVRGRIESILHWAAARGLRSGDNPARWRGHLDKLLPAPSKVRRVRHQPALPYPELPAFMKELRSIDATSARALEFTILSAARTSAVIRATPSEFDLAAKIWTVQPDRVGAKVTEEEATPRRVPLSDRAIAIVRSMLSDESEFVFPGQKQGAGLSDMAMLEMLRDLRPGYTVHGFRSTFKDWAAETTGFPNEVSEAALWHVVEDKVEAAYRRGDLFVKRRRLMNEWERYCARPANASGQVVALRR